ncbi:hypothetical protein HYV86_07730 [Candidatus Woesearchaeota archaeon]|nr:hypothetical protein [Candidatus Woesearchaeota archaeon]
MAFLDHSGQIKTYTETKLKLLLFSHPVIKFIFFIILNYVLTLVSKYFPSNFFLRTLTTIVNIGIAIYFVLAIIYILHRKWKHLMSPKNVFSLLWAYVFFVIVIILVFSTIFSVIELTGLGYLKYGSCSDQFDTLLVDQDPLASHDFFYFSAVTYFTVGYGDICPMGLMKFAAIFDALVGHLVSVIIVALIINNYLRSREDQK